MFGCGTSSVQQESRGGDGQQRTCPAQSQEPRGQSSKYPKKKKERTWIKTAETHTYLNIHEQVYLRGTRLLKRCLSPWGLLPADCEYKPTWQTLCDICHCDFFILCRHPGVVSDVIKVLKDYRCTSVGSKCRRGNNQIKLETFDRDKTSEYVYVQKMLTLQSFFYIV